MRQLFHVAAAGGVGEHPLLIVFIDELTEEEYESRHDADAFLATRTRIEENPGNAFFGAQRPDFGVVLMAATLDEGKSSRLIPEDEQEAITTERGFEVAMAGLLIYNLISLYWPEWVERQAFEDEAEKLSAANTWHGDTTVEDA